MEDSSSSSSELASSSSLSGGMPESGNGTGPLNQGRRHRRAGSNPAASATEGADKVSNWSRKPGGSKGSGSVTSTFRQSKQCNHCLQTKPIDEFSKHKGGKLGRHPKCKPCRALIEREKWQNDERDKSRLKLAKHERIQRNREYVAHLLLGRCCEECGNEDPRVLDFDHLDPDTKCQPVSQMVTKGTSIETIQNEIDKCRILCANCHRIHTIKQMGYFDRTSLCRSGNGLVCKTKFTGSIPVGDSNE